MTSPRYAPANDGFSLIESLVALAVLGVIVGVLVRVHVQTLRADGFADVHGQAILGAETVLTGVMLGDDPQAIVDDAAKRGWVVASIRNDRFVQDSFWEWRVAVSNAGPPVVALELRGGLDEVKTSKTEKPAK